MIWAMSVLYLVAANTTKTPWAETFFMVISVALGVWYMIDVALEVFR